VSGRAGNRITRAAQYAGLVTLTAAEANARFYAEHAELYDRTEPCLVDPHQRQRLERSISHALTLLGDNPRVLDACGGSGNAGTVLLHHGVVPVVVDVSREMTALWAEKAHQAGVTPEIHVGTVESFLAADPRQWDLMTFCSALHHLEDPGVVLRAAAQRLAAGGLILTMFDPTRGEQLLRHARKADWLLELARTEPRHLIRLGSRVVRRRARGEDRDASVGRIAERHAYTGIDDLALTAELRELGLEVLIHHRYVDARTGAMRGLLRVAGRPSHFHLLVRGLRA
jgi:ubiquinone/menaquinone biosynthesis C-methylase UbiE